MVEFRKCMEYAASVWDPHTSADNNRLEQVQRRCVRFTMNKNWEKTSGCVTKMVHDLGWQALEENRRKLRLTMLFKFQHGLKDGVPSHILRPNGRRTRGAH